MHKNFEIGICFCISLGFSVAFAQERSTAIQPNQEVLVEQLRGDQARYGAFNEIRAIPPENVGLALRDALIEELERTNDLKELSLSTGIGFVTLESPDYVSELELVVAALKDPKTFPALAHALGNGTVVAQLADQGEQAAPAVLDVVTDTASHHYVVDDALIILRMMIENQAAQPLSSETIARIHDAAEQRLTGTQYFTTVWYAIDLAAVLKDPELEQKLELISSYSSEVLAFGIEESELIEQTQRRAAERLAGVPPKPRREDLPRY
jgi:hypothetical protein